MASFFGLFPPSCARIAPFVHTSSLLPSSLSTSFPFSLSVRHHRLLPPPSAGTTTSFFLYRFPAFAFVDPFSQPFFRYSKTVAPNSVLILSPSLLTRLSLV